MVYARHAVGRRRSFEENEFRSTFPQFERFLESMILFPSVQYLIADFYEVQTFIFCK